MTNFQTGPKLYDIQRQFDTLWGAAPVSLERMIVIKAMAKAKERRVNDSYSETLLDGCKEVVRMLFENLSPHALTVGAKELEAWAREQGELRKLAEIHIVWTRDAWFVNSNIGEVAPELAALKIALSEDKIMNFSTTEQHEHANETFNRFLSDTANLKNKIDIASFLSLRMAVMACKRLGSDVLGWRY
jgi:hypothetical protein